MRRRPVLVSKARHNRVVADDDFVALLHRDSAGAPPDVALPGGVHVCRSYATPFGDAYVGVAWATKNPSDTGSLHVLGVGLPHGSLPVADRKIGATFWLRRAALHQGVEGSIDAQPVALRQHRGAGWSPSRRRRAISVELGGTKLVLRAVKDSSAVLSCEARVVARLRMTVGLNAERPPRDISKKPLVSCSRDATADEVVLAILLCEWDAPQQAAHPITSLVDLGL